MKVLIITGIFPPDIGGPATYSKMIYDELPLSGISTDLVSFSDLKRYPKVLRHIILFFRIIKKTKGVDLYYAQDPVSVGVPTMLASIITSKKYILKIVGDYAWEQGCQRSNVKDLIDEFSCKKRGYGMLVYFLKKLQIVTAERACNIIVPSFYLKKIVSNWGLKNTNKIQVIYNSFDFDDSVRLSTEYKKEANIKKNTVISVGRLVPWKGFDTLIVVIGNMPDVNLIIAGSGPDEERLQNIIEHNKFSNIKLVGALDQNILFKYISLADLFVLNTSYEGFSHQLLEVMALGTPIVTTSVGGNLELIEDGVNGILVPYNDSAKLRSSIIRSLNGDVFTAGLVKNGLDKIKEFSVKNNVFQLSELINRVRL